MIGTGRAGLRRLAIAGVLATMTFSTSYAQSATGRGLAVRLVGVYDSESGAPIEGAKVRDVLTGLSVSTTRTGTAYLLPADTATTLISITSAGYRPLMLILGNSPRDTTPLTVLMEPSGTVLPAVVSRAHKSGALGEDDDDVARLEHVGFYDRQHSSIAPSVSFVTAATLAHWNVHSLDELAAVSGRSLCTGNLYIDGAKVQVPSRKNADGPGTISLSFESPADEMVDIGDIAGIETYRDLEVPAEYGWGGCVSLIWTK